MRKILLFIISILCCMNMQAQLTKIHTFNQSFGIHWDVIAYESNFWGKYYVTHEGTTFYFYNWDFSYHHSWTLTQIPEGYVFSDILSTSKKCINNDEKWELVVKYSSQDYTYGSNENTKVWIIDENNTFLQDLGCANSFYFGGFHKNGNELRVMTTRVMMDENNNYQYIYEIYRCAGNGGNLNINEITDNIIEPAYPNPAHNTITLPYNINGNQTSEMHIYDIQGRLVKTIPVGPHFNEINVDVSSFPSGTYIYECNGVSNKFVVN